MLFDRPLPSGVNNRFFFEISSHQSIITRLVNVLLALLNEPVEETRDEDAVWQFLDLIFRAPNFDVSMSFKNHN